MEVRIQVNNDPLEAADRDTDFGMLAAGCREEFAGAEESMRQLHDQGQIVRRLDDGTRVTFIARRVSTATVAKS